jgi:UDP-glucose 4-epimerase
VTTGGALYGNATSQPVAEDDPIEPLSPYGLSKWAAERYLPILADGRMSWFALRLGNVFGPRQSAGGEAGVVAIFADRMRRGGEITIDGDGEQTRDFVFVADVAEAVLLALHAQRSGSVNVATGAGTSVNKLFVELAGIAGYTRAPFRGPPRPADVRYSVLDVRRASSLLGWAARTPLRDGLMQTYKAMVDR